MSSIIFFDIRNFSTHFSHLSSREKNKDKKWIIVDLVKNIFKSLEKAIDKSRTDLEISRETFINHTGDGFVVILFDNERSLKIKPNMILKK